MTPSSLPANQISLSYTGDFEARGVVEAVDGALFLLVEPLLGAPEVGRGVLGKEVCLRLAAVKLASLLQEEALQDNVVDGDLFFAPAGVAQCHQHGACGLDLVAVDGLAAALGLDHREQRAAQLLRDVGEEEELVAECRQAKVKHGLAVFGVVLVLVLEEKGYNQKN